jgi:hypothetical protein
MPDSKPLALLLGLAVALASLTYSSARLEGLFHHRTLFVGLLAATNVAIYSKLRQEPHE